MFLIIGLHRLPGHHLPGEVKGQQMPKRFDFWPIAAIEVTAWVDARPE